MEVMTYNWLLTAKESFKNTPVAAHVMSEPGETAARTMILASAITHDL